MIERILIVKQRNRSMLVDMYACVQIGCAWREHGFASLRPRFGRRGVARSYRKGSARHGVRRRAAYWSHGRTCCRAEAALVARKPRQPTTPPYMDFMHYPVCNQYKDFRCPVLAIDISLQDNAFCEVSALAINEIFVGYLFRIVSFTRLIWILKSKPLKEKIRIRLIVAYRAAG